MQQTLNVFAGCLVKFSGSTYQYEFSQRVEFRVVSLFHLWKLQQQGESRRANISADQLCFSHIRLVRRQQLRLASECFAVLAQECFQVLLLFCSFDEMMSRLQCEKSKKSKSPYLCLQKLSVFLHHLIYRLIFWF